MYRLRLLLILFSFHPCSMLVLGYVSWPNGMAEDGRRGSPESRAAAFRIINASPITHLTHYNYFFFLISRQNFATLRITGRTGVTPETLTPCTTKEEQRGPYTIYVICMQAYP